MSWIDCPFCQQSHAALMMCPPARRVLEALQERGMRFDMPTLEFPEPVEGAVGVFGGGTVAVAQIVAKSAVAEAAGVFVPVLVLTGVDAEGRPLPEWMFAAGATDMRKMTALIAEIGDQAVRGAATANAAGNRS